MKVQDLNREQLTQLKADYLENQLLETEGRGISYGEIVEADNLVSDVEIFEAFDGYTFTPDDFCA